MADNQRAKHGQPSQPGGKGSGKNQQGQARKKEEGRVGQRSGVAQDKESQKQHGKGR